jgi:hypothetical protein
MITSEMRDDGQWAGVRAKVESAEISRDPFPHVVVADLLPEEFFERLTRSIPPLEGFDQSRYGLKANLGLGEHKKVFRAASEDFKSVWRQWRDQILREEIAPVLVRRLEPEIREKYVQLLSPELADRIMGEGLVVTDGRIMSRKPGYVLKAHTDPGLCAVTCLLYFTEADDQSSGALCLFRPDRVPELKTLGTYYAELEEGISAELVETIPIRANLFVAFLNGPASLHGVSIDRVGDVEPMRSRITYQAHILPRNDIGQEAEEFADALPEPAARRRWQPYAERQREKRASGAAEQA